MSFLSSSRRCLVGSRRLAVGISIWALLAPACGKRGDPLPPLRPIPNAPEGLVVRQVGNKVFLEWTAPNRNHDGTVEKLDLREAEIFRRVLDLPTLIEEQTVYPSEEDAPSEEGADESSVEDSSDTIPSQPVAPASGPETTGRDLPAATSTDSETIRSRVETPRPLGQEPAWTSATPEVLLPPSPGEELAPGQATLSDAVDPFAASETAGLPAPAPTLQLFDFRIDSKPIATVPSSVPGEVATYEEELEPEWIGLRVEYGVLYINQKNRPGPLSNIGQIEPELPLPTPVELSAKASDGFVALSWVAATDPEQRELEFAVFRRSGATETFSETRLNDSLLTEEEFQDRSAVFGSRWCYVVRSVLPPPPPPEPLLELPEGLSPEEAEALAGDIAGVVAESAPDTASQNDAANVAAAAETAERVAAEALEQATTPGGLDPEAPGPDEPAGPIVPVVPPITTLARIESASSAEVCLTPEDVFPPPAPSGLVAVSGNAGMLLSWRHVGAADAAGYRVYRATEPGGPFELLTEGLLDTPSFTDGTAQIGETYYYAVTTVDSSPAANESDRSASARATHTP